MLHLDVGRSSLGAWGRQPRPARASPAAAAFPESPGVAPPPLISDLRLILYFHLPPPHPAMLRSALSSLGLFRRPAPSFAPAARVAPAPSPIAAMGVRFRGQLAPRKTKYRKSQKGRPSVSLREGLNGRGQRLTAVPDCEYRASEDGAEARDAMPSFTRACGDAQEGQRHRVQRVLRVGGMREIVPTASALAACPHSTSSRLQPSSSSANGRLVPPADPRVARSRARRSSLTVTACACSPLCA
jgi:hypothetical protein